MNNDDGIDDILPENVYHISTSELPFKTHRLTAGASVLMEAALFGDLELCQQLVANGADLLEKTNERQASVMHFAAVNRRHGLDIIYYLLNLGCNIYEEDGEGAYPIDYAIREGAFVLAQNLLELQFVNGNLLYYCIYRNNLVFAQEVHNYNSTLFKEINPRGLHAIHFAAKHADRSVCKWLIDELDVDVESVSELSKSTALQYVGYNSKHGEDLVPFFIERGLDVNRTNRDGSAPICYALENENIRVAEAMRAFNADLRVKVDERNLLFFCVERNKLLSAKWTHKEDPEQIEQLAPDGKTILQFALTFADGEMCRWLHEEGVDIPYKGRGLLHIAAANLAYGKEVVGFCVNTLGLDVEATRDDEETPIVTALLSTNIDAAEELFQHGANLRVSLGGASLLHLCLSALMPHSVKFLYAKDKTLFDQVHEGRTIAQFAAEYANRKLFKWLVQEAQIDALALDEPNGRTVLHYACMNRMFGINIAKYVITKLKIDVNVKCKKGVVPLAIALFHKNVKLAEFLCQRGADFRVKQQGCNLLAMCVKWDALASAKFMYNKDRSMLEEELADGQTLFHYACTFANYKMCIWLSEREVNPFVPCKLTQFTALHFAALNRRHGDAVVIYLITELNMDVNQKAFGSTPLGLATCANNSISAGALCFYGADLSVELNGANLLIECVYTNALDVARVLHRADKTMVEKFTPGGKNALHIAAEVGNLRFCKWIVETGFDIRTKTKDGRSVFDLAPWFHREMKEFFNACYEKLNM